MKYEDVDPLLLEFLREPITHLESVAAVKPPVRWSTRQLYRIPSLRRFISPEQLLGVLLEKLLQGLENANQSLSRSLFEDHAPADEHLHKRYVAELRKYFDIDFIGLDRDSLGEPQRDWLERISHAHTFAKLEYTCNRVAESLKLRAEHNFAILSNPNLWLSYYLSEIYFLLAHDLMQAQLRGRVVYISPSERMASRLKAYWLSEISEENSRFSDMRMMLDVAPILHRHGHLPEPLKHQLVNQVMDKCLSLHVDYVSDAMGAEPQYALLREMVYFAAHLELNALLGRNETPVAQMRLHVSPATIEMINSRLAGQQATLDAANSFVEHRGEVYRRGPVKLKYGLKKLIGQVLEKDFASQLGTRFEVDYVLKYLRDLDDPRFVVHDGFKAKTGAKVLGYDVDLVLQDLEEDVYYFIQVKYKVFELPVYYSEQCRFMTDATFRKGFDKQLAVLKANIAEPSIRHKLSQLGLAGAHEGNSHFVLLHNLPFLNFYELDGIYFYEWNLLRNILRNGRVQYRKDHDIVEHCVLRKARLHRPDEMVEAYFEDGQDAAQMKEAYQLYLRTYSHFAYDDLHFVCKVV